MLQLVVCACSVSADTSNKMGNYIPSNHGNFGFCGRCLTWVKSSGMDFYETKHLFIFTSILTNKMSGQGKERSLYSAAKVTHGS